MAAGLLLSAGCAPAGAYNVRLQDVENKAMQGGYRSFPCYRLFCPACSGPSQKCRLLAGSLALRLTCAQQAFAARHKSMYSIQVW